MIDRDLLREIVREQRAAQGLPPTIEDERALSILARMVYGNQEAKGKTPAGAVRKAS